MHVTQFNWGGIIFVLLICPASGLATVALRWWSNQAARSHKEPTEVWVRPANALDSSTYSPAPHEHIFDLTRSPRVDVNDRGTRLSCAVSGCDVTQFYPRDVPVPIEGFTPISTGVEAEKER